MTSNFRGIFLVALFCCIAPVLFGQESGLKHRITWTKDEYALRYEVVIEKETNGSYAVVTRESTEETFILVSLPPGNYRLRVTPYDIRNIPGDPTPWRNLTVAAPPEPAEPQIANNDVPPAPTPPPSNNLTEAPNNNPPESTEDTLPEKHRDLYAGLLAEVLGYTRYNAAFGGGISFGGSFNGMGLGINLLYAQDTEGYISMEALAHFRYYFSFLTHAEVNTGLFLQAEGGAVLFAYKKPAITGYWSPVVGLAAGWRFPLSARWYIEPRIRGGYPYYFGVGVSGGMRFNK